MARVQDREVAGLMADPGGSMHPAWTVFVEVASIEEPLERATAAGGTVLQQPMDRRQS